MNVGSFAYTPSPHVGGRDRAAEVAELAAQEGSGALIVLYAVVMFVVIFVLLCFVAKAEDEAERSIRK